MAHKMITPRSLLLYLVALVAFFFLGVTYAGITEAGKNQGLAAGAIVIGYGVIAALLGLVAALYAAYIASPKRVKWLTLICILIIGICYAYFHFQYMQRQKAKAQAASLYPAPALYQEFRPSNARLVFS